ncbi:MAG: polysaccharide deacetylase family protein [Clostridium sp.]
MRGNRKIGSRINMRTVIIGGILLLVAVGVFNIFSMVITTVFSPKTTEILGANSEVSAKPKPLPTDIVKGKNVTHEGEKYCVPGKKVLSMLENTYEGEGKRVFLTFDDGPSPNTVKVLDILDKEDVKGTFFVLGQRLEDDKS